MKSFCDTVGILKVVIAKGYISTYEISHLEKDSMVYFYDRECGMPCSLYFNDRLISLCKIVIIDNNFAARVEDSYSTPETKFTKPLIEDSEIHNSELVLGSREITLSQLSKLTRGSIIPFKTFSEFTPDTPMTGLLKVSGIDVSLGRIGIAGEKWVLKISDNLLERDRDIPRRDSHLPYSDNFKPYDFTRPDCITRSNFHTFNKIHSYFTNYIGGSIKEIDQMTWGELKDEYSSFNLMILRKEPITNNNVEEKVYYLPMDGSTPDKTITDMVKSWAIESRNDQLMEKVGVFYNSTEVSDLFTSGFSTKELLEASWRDITYTTFGEKKELPLSTKDFIEDWSMIVIVKIEYKQNELILIYPLQYFEQILERM